MIKQTPYYHKWKELGATFQDRGGFATVNFLTSIEDEHRAVRERVGIFDVGYQVAVEIRGRDAQRVLERALVNDVRRLTDGRAQYSTICNQDGGVLDDLTCFRLASERFWISPSPSRVSAVANFLESVADDLDATVTNLALSNAYLSIQGPRSRDLLSALTDADLSTNALPYFAFTQARLGDIPKATISRTGFSGELGYELFFPVEYAEYLWDRVLHVGEPYALLPCGMKALRSLRIEKKYLLYGLDLTETTDPLAAGLGWTVRFDDRQFSGRAALEQIVRTGPKNTLCLLETAEFHPVAHGDEVMYAGKVVGTVTSADPGYSFSRTFALAYLPMAVAEPDRQIEIVAQGTHIPARVMRWPPYDPGRRRLTA